MAVEYAIARHMIQPGRELGEQSGLGFRRAAELIAAGNIGVLVKMASLLRRRNPPGDTT